MIDVLINPPQPQPETARPSRNKVMFLANAVMKSPRDRTRLEKKTNTRGVNISESRPARGVMLDIAILVPHVSHL